MKKNEPLELITIGRSSVDLYGAQVGGRLEDMRSFQKYVGGSPTNIASGAARLGLRSAVITKVGDEHMGRFIKEQLQKEGVDVRGVLTDPDRLTALVILGIRDKVSFPLIFYRENCADMALTEGDISEKFISEANCICATGTHLSNPKVEKATLKAIQIGRKLGKKTALDIDYRPNLWGLSGHGDGENRYIRSQLVTQNLQKHLMLFDLIVGTEEEFHIAGGSTNTIEALQSVRAKTPATLVCKRGHHGASIFEDDIAYNLNEGIQGQKFSIEVFNVLGAGDGFMAGLLRGWLRNENWSTCLDFANACGAIAVSRHGCAPSYPSWEELSFFLKTGVRNQALRKDIELENIHWSTTRSSKMGKNFVFAFDHRVQFEELAQSKGKKSEDINSFKELCLRAAIDVAREKDGFGIICDDRLGRSALHHASDYNLWIARPAEVPKSWPLRFEDDVGEGCHGLTEWPNNHSVKVLCYYNPRDPKKIKIKQEQSLLKLFDAARRNQLEFLLEIIVSRQHQYKNQDILDVVNRLYGLGIRPDWWKLEPLTSIASWKKMEELINTRDRFCKGVLLLGLDQPIDFLGDCFKLASHINLVKGFAVGRSIFGEIAEDWFSDRLTDSESIKLMSQNFQLLCDRWISVSEDKSHL